MASTLYLKLIEHGPEGDNELYVKVAFEKDVPEEELVRMWEDGLRPTGRNTYIVISEEEYKENAWDEDEDE